MLKFRFFLEKYGFAVSSRLAEKLGMRAKDVRIAFIYGTFATLGVWCLFIISFFAENQRLIIH